MRGRACAALGAIALGVGALAGCGGNAPTALYWDEGTAAGQVQYDAEQAARDNDLPERAVGTVTCRDSGYDQAGYHTFTCRVPVLGSVTRVRLLADAEGHRIEVL